MYSNIFFNLLKDFFLFKTSPWALHQRESRALLGDALVAHDELLHGEGEEL